jgi:hypothetical protein
MHKIISPTKEHCCLCLHAAGDWMEREGREKRRERERDGEIIYHILF